MKTFKSYMAESKEKRGQLASIKLAMQAAATYLDLFLTDRNGNIDLTLTAKEKLQVRQIIKELQIGAREISK